jgi:hypothetical protein
VKTRVTYTLVVEIEDAASRGGDMDNEQYAIEWVMDEPQAHIKQDGSNLAITTERVGE